MTHMAEKKQPPAKKKTHVAGSILDGVGWLIGQAALPMPDFLFEKRKKSKKK
jgi:hypothetical protein